MNDPTKIEALTSDDRDLIAAMRSIKSLGRFVGAEPMLLDVIEKLLAEIIRLQLVAGVAAP